MTVVYQAGGEHPVVNSQKKIGIYPNWEEREGIVPGSNQLSIQIKRISIATYKTLCPWSGAAEGMTLPCRSSIINEFVLVDKKNSGFLLKLQNKLRASFIKVRDLTDLMPSRWTINYYHFRSSKSLTGLLTDLSIYVHDLFLEKQIGTMQDIKLISSMMEEKWIIFTLCYLVKPAVCVAQSIIVG